jgi:hypothetical protein
MGEGELELCLPCPKDATVYTQVIELPKNLEKPHPGSATQNLSLSLLRRGKDLPLG